MLQEWFQNNKLESGATLDIIMYYVHENPSNGNTFLIRVLIVHNGKNYPLWISACDKDIKEFKGKKGSKQAHLLG